LSCSIGKFEIHVQRPSPVDSDDSEEEPPYRYLRADEEEGEEMLGGLIDRIKKKRKKKKKKKKKPASPVPAPTRPPKRKIIWRPNDSYQSVFPVILGCNLCGDDDDAATMVLETSYINKNVRGNDQIHEQMERKFCDLLKESEHEVFEKIHDCAIAIYDCNELSPGEEAQLMMQDSVAVADDVAIPEGDFDTF